MKTFATISINQISEDYHEYFIKLAELTDKWDETTIEAEVEFDDWQPEQRESWGYDGGCEYIPAGFCSIYNLSYKGVNILSWLSKHGYDYVLRNQNSVADYCYDY
jgi:hypothetical protein